MAFAFAGEFLGVKAGSVAINNDFENLVMEAPVMLAYVQLVLAGLPKRLALQMLQAGGRIADDEDLDVLAAEWDGELAAAAAQKALEAAANQPPPNPADPTTPPVPIPPAKKPAKKPAAKKKAKVPA